MDKLQQDDAEWARLVYRNQLEGTELVKRRQWLITNYILLLYAAVIGFLQIYYNSPCEKNWRLAAVLIFATYSINFVGTHHIFDMQRVLAEYRTKAFNLTREKYYPILARIDFINGGNEHFYSKYIDLALFFIVLISAGWSLVFVYSARIMKFAPYTAVDVFFIFISFEVMFSFIFFSRQHYKFCEFINKVETINK